MELKELRKEIDKIDSEIVELITKRYGIAKEIAKIKKNLEVAVQDKNREEGMIKELARKFKEKGVDDEDFVREIFGAIIKKSRKIQESEIANNS